MRRAMHVAAVGFGPRVTQMTNTLSSLEGVRIDMICDVYEERIAIWSTG